MVDPTGHWAEPYSHSMMASGMKSGLPGDIHPWLDTPVISNPEPEQNSVNSGSNSNSSGTVTLSDGRTVASNDEGTIVPSLTDLYNDTLENYEIQEMLHYGRYPDKPFRGSGVIFVDYSYNAGAWLGMTGGYSYIVNLNQGWVAEYEHVGPNVSVGVAPASVQITTGRVMGDDMTSPLFYEGWFREFSASAGESYANAVSVFNNSGSRPVIQEGGGMETTIGITANLSLYWLTNIVYIRGGDNE